KLGDVVLSQPAAERLQIGIEKGIGAVVRKWLFRLAHPFVPSEKTRSRAVKTRIGWPCWTLIVAGRLESRWAAIEAALCPAPPTITVDAPPVARVPAPPSIESRIDDPKRDRKWLFTCPPIPAWPEKSAAGDARAIETPSGRTSRVHMRKARRWPAWVTPLYSPISRDERGIRTLLPS